MSKLARIVRRFQSGTSSSTDAAELIRLVQEEKSVHALEHLLHGLYDDFGGIILDRIAELLPREDPDLCLSLALWNHRNGHDDEAFHFLEKARAIAPFDQETLRCDLWLSVTAGEEDASQKCSTLLQMYPDDNWAEEICRLIAKENPPRSIESPQWNNPWEDRINGRRPLHD